MSINTLDPFGSAAAQQHSRVQRGASGGRGRGGGRREPRGLRGGLGGPTGPDPLPLCEDGGADLDACMAELAVPQPLADVGPEADMDMAEVAEVDALSECSRGELDATYAADAEPMCAVVAAADIGASSGGYIDVEEPDPEVVKEVAVASFASMEAIGADLPAEAASSTSSGIHPAAAPAAGEGASHVDQPWLRLSDPSPLGYLYFEGRSVMRVQVGKPKGSCSINCYFHPGCKAFISEERCPPLLELKQWLFRVPAPEDSATAVQRRALAEQHMEIFKKTWSKPSTCAAPGDS